MGVKQQQLIDDVGVLKQENSILKQNDTCTQERVSRLEYTTHTLSRGVKQLFSTPSFLHLHPTRACSGF
eukprot:1146718-Pelagomonas_calceolata.AAC.3